MKKIIFFVTFFNIALFSFSQWSTDLNINLLLSGASEDVSNPQVITTSTGSYYVVWPTFDGLSIDYKIILLDNGGNNIWPSAISAHSNDMGTGGYAFSTALDSADNLIVICTQDSSGTLKTNVNKIAPDGSQLWNSTTGIKLGNTTPSSSLLLSNGDLLVGLSDGNIYRLDANGNNVWTGTTHYVQTDTLGCTNELFYENADSTISVVYFSPAGGPGYGDLYYTKIDKNGNNILGHSEKLFGEPLAAWYTIKIAASKNGALHVFTDQGVGGFVTSVFMQTMVSDLPQLGYGVRLDLDLPTTASLLDVIIDHNHNKAMVLYQYQVILDSIGLKLQRVNLNDQNLDFGPNGKVMKDGLTSNFGSVSDALVEGGNDYVYAYINQTTQQIFADKIDSLGNIIWSEPLCLTNTDKDYTAWAAYEGTQYVLAFNDDRDADFFTKELYIQNIKDFTTSVFEQKESVNTIYPNPTRDKLYITNNNVKDAPYFIYNNLGELIEKGNVVGAEINVSHLSPSFYYIKYRNNSEKFIKIDQ